MISITSITEIYHDGLALIISECDIKDLKKVALTCRLFSVIISSERLYQILLKKYFGITCQSVQALTYTSQSQFRERWKEGLVDKFVNTANCILSYNDRTITCEDKKLEKSTIILGTKIISKGGKYTWNIHVDLHEYVRIVVGIAPINMNFSERFGYSYYGYFLDLIFGNIYLAAPYHRSKSTVKDVTINKSIEPIKLEFGYDCKYDCEYDHKNDHSYINFESSDIGKNLCHELVLSGQYRLCIFLTINSCFSSIINHQESTYTTITLT